MDAEIIETTARRLDKGGLGQGAAFVRALDGKLNYLPAAVRGALLSNGRRADVRERDVGLAPDASDHDEIDAGNRALLERLRQAEHPKLRALAALLRGNDPPETLTEAAQRLHVSDRHLRRLLGELRRL